MAIVSISLKDGLLAELDALGAGMGSSGRSEVVRAGLRLLSESQREKSKLKGTVEAVLLVMHDERHSDAILSAGHGFQKIIKTQLHSDLSTGKCLDLFILRGDAKDVKRLSNFFESSGKVERARLFVV